jgi:Protein of unknown function (DUF3006)
MVAMRRTRGFVDRVEEGMAVVIVDGEAVKLPRGLLPANTGEGAWVEIAVEKIDVPEGAKEAEELRRRLARDDDGGDFGL